jgi:hypothetical protein
MYEVVTSFTTVPNNIIIPPLPSPNNLYTSIKSNNNKRKIIIIYICEQF